MSATLVAQRMVENFFVFSHSPSAFVQLSLPAGLSAQSVNRHQEHVFLALTHARVMQRVPTRLDHSPAHARADTLDTDMTLDDHEECGRLVVSCKSTDCAHCLEGTWDLLES